MTFHGTLNKTQVPCDIARPQLMEPFLTIWPLLALLVPLQSTCNTLPAPNNQVLSLSLLTCISLFREFVILSLPPPQVPIILYFVLGSYAASLNSYCFVCLLVWQMFSQNPLQGVETLSLMVIWLTEQFKAKCCSINKCTQQLAYICKCYWCTQHSVLTGAFPKNVALLAQWKQIFRGIYCT